jgi:hypothetical protein
MVDYQPLLTRAVAKLASTGTFAARHSIYERVRRAQRAQLRTRRPPLPESDIVGEEEALELAIALVEAKFGFTGATLPRQSVATRTLATATQQANERFATDVAQTDALIFRPHNLAKSVPPNARTEKSGTWLWHACTAALATFLAFVLGAVLTVAGAGIVMRDTPPDLARALPEAPQEPVPQQPAKIVQRAQSSVTESFSTAPSANVPPGDQPTGQSGTEPANQASDASSPALPDTARAAMLIASENPQRPMLSLGSTVWSTIPPAPGRPATVAVKADADIPGLKMHASMTLRKNTDPTLPATYTIDLKFSFADGALVSGVKDVEPKMRNLGSTASEALTSVKVKISDLYFLIALVNGDQDTARNPDLIQTRAWFDFPLLLSDNRVAKLLFQKSLKGEAILAKAFEAWK